MLSSNAGAAEHHGDYLGEFVEAGEHGGGLSIFRGAQRGRMELFCIVKEATGWSVTYWEEFAKHQ